MVEHLLCKQGVVGSSPFTSTKNWKNDWIKEFIEKVKKKNDLTNQGELTEKLTYKKNQQAELRRKGVYV